MKQYKFKLLLHKKYFDIGYGFTNYVKYIIALFGLSSLNVRLTLMFAGVYAVGCYIFGWLFVKHGWYSAQIEVGNRFNLFVEEMRKIFKDK